MGCTERRLTIRSSRKCFVAPLIVVACTTTRRHYAFRLNSGVSRLETRIIWPMLYSPAFTFSSVYPLGVLPCAGFAFGCCASFKPFWPPALVGHALLAIILQALRRLRGAELFRGLCPSSSWGFPFWLLGLTVQSSRPAFGGRLTFIRYA